MADPLKPSPALLCKIGSIIVHFDEFTSPGGHPFDIKTARDLLADAEVSEWMQTMQKMTMLPLKRSRP